MKHSMMLTAATLSHGLASAGTSLAGASSEVECNINGSANWSLEKHTQIVRNRLTDAGNGNGSELMSGYCFQGDPKDESADYEQDPGNSGKHNANNDKTEF